MANKWLESFDYYATADLTTVFANSLVSGTSATLSIGAFGRNGTNGLRIATATGNAGASSMYAYTPNLGAGSATVIVGFSFKFSALPGARNLSILSIMNSAFGVETSLVLTTAGTLAVVRGNVQTGTTLATGTTVLSAGTQYYLELKVKVDTATGTYDLRINGNGTPEVSGSGVNTSSSATNSWAMILLGNLTVTGGYTSANWDYDDMYVNDSTGAANNDFWGDVRVVGQLPSTGNGTNADWTPSTGTDHGALVDENPPNTSDYNSSNTTGQRDTYNFPSLGLTGTVKAVQTDMYLAKSDAGVRTVAPVWRISGVNYDGTAVNIGTSFYYYRQNYDVSPATTSAWTTGEINGAETGAKLVA